MPDVLATIYSMEWPVPVPRLAESVWQGVEARFDLDRLSPFILRSLRARTGRDVEHIFDAFEALGAVTSVPAMASEMFLQDLTDPAASPFDRARSAALRRQLKGPVRLVALTPLGTSAMRERMLAEGREAALVGELADAAPAEMLGVVAGHRPVVLLARRPELRLPPTSPGRSAPARSGHADTDSRTCAGTTGATRRGLISFGPWFLVVAVAVEQVLLPGRGREHDDHASRLSGPGCRWQDQ
ncbi:MAG TPA: hypothetical protein VGG25_21710 [Streptosporangiaceae bacterium]